MEILMKNVENEMQTGLRGYVAAEHEMGTGSILSFVAE